MNDAMHYSIISVLEGGMVFSLHDVHLSTHVCLYSIMYVLCRFTMFTYPPMSAFAAGCAAGSSSGGVVGA